MRSSFSGIIIVMLSASMAIPPTAPAQQDPQRSPGYRHIQARVSQRQPTKDYLQSSLDDLKGIEKDNGDFDLPASQDGIMGAVQVHSKDEAQMKRIEQDSMRFDGEVDGVCGGC